MADEPVRVLLIEDDPDDYLLTREWLAEIPDQQFALDWISRYDAGREALLRQEHDVYLLDYRLGARTGLELLREAIAAGVKAPVILLTGQGEQETDIAAMKAGAADYLIKGRLDALLLGRSLRYAIERKRAEEERVRLLASEQAAQARVEMTQRLQALTEAALAHVEMDRLLSELLGRIVELLVVDTAAILLKDADDSLVVRAARGLDEAAVQWLRVPIGEGFAGRVAAERRSICVEDVDAAQMINPIWREKGIRSLLGAPLLVKDQVLGVLHVGTLDRHPFAEEDIRLLQLAADRAALAIAHAQLFQQLQEANRKKDEFLAMLAHELRNPLGACSNAVQIIRRREVTDPPLQRAITILERQVKHQARIVDDLLDVSRITRGKIALEREWLDLVRLVRHAAEDHRAILEAAGLQLSLDLPEEPVWVAGDPTRLAQVLGNLLTNAAKFTDAGGAVTVSVASGQWPVGSGGNNIPSSRPLSQLPTDHCPLTTAVVTVRDTGMGIDPEMQPHVFEIFEQADRSLDRTRGGLGLGLALVKGWVALHGGEVRVFSEGLGRGAEFAFTLPIAPEAPRSPARMSPREPAVPSERPPAAQRILVVEDNPDMAETLRDLLELLGYQVTVAGTGPAGLEAIRRIRPEVVLCDIGLPGIDGYAVARAVRQDPETASIRLIALSGYGQEEDQRCSREAGFEWHLVKPVNFADLQQLLSTLGPGGSKTSQGSIPSR